MTSAASDNPVELGDALEPVGKTVDVFVGQVDELAPQVTARDVPREVQLDQGRDRGVRFALSLPFIH